MSSLDLAAVWTVLETTPPKAGVEAVPTGDVVTAGDLLAGVDDEGRRYLMVPLLPGEAAPVDTRGRAVRLSRLGHAGSQFLTVVCLSPELFGQFTQFCKEVVAATQDAASPARAAADAYERWKALFSDDVVRGALGESGVVGLIAELATLTRLLELGAPSDVRPWRGPFGDQHDFRSPTHAVEVKATLLREGRIVSISSIDQLDAAPGVTLHLVHRRYERDPSGQSLADAIEAAVKAGASRSDLFLALAELGIYADDLAQYDDRRFRALDVRIYDVTGETFPRLIGSSFVDGDVPPGILRVSYSIDLTNEPPVPLTDDLATEVLRDLAVETV